MRKSLLGMAIALCGFLPATPALAADYAPPPPAYYPMPMPAPSSCCCPTVRRGLWVSPWSCGYQSPAYYQPAPVYYPQPYAEPAYYQPGYEPQVGVAVGVRYKKPRKHCRRSHGQLVCR